MISLKIRKKVCVALLVLTLLVCAGGAAGNMGLTETQPHVTLAGGINNGGGCC